MMSLLGTFSWGLGARKQVRVHGIIHTRALPFVYWRLVSNVVSTLLASYQPRFVIPRKSLLHQEPLRRDRQNPLPLVS